MIKFITWKYAENNNCWDYVREFLIEIAGVPPSDIPKFDISPHDKKSMTSASTIVAKNFNKVDKPKQFSIVCANRKFLLYHVGIYYDKKVWHAHDKMGCIRQSLSDFIAQNSNVTFYSHKYICLL